MRVPVLLSKLFSPSQLPLQLAPNIVPVGYVNIALCSLPGGGDHKANSYECDSLMNALLARCLIAEFPRLFRDWIDGTAGPAIECGDGWYGLIRKLAMDIESVAADGGIDPASESWPLCRRIKQKFGSLRFVVFAVQGHPNVSERIAELRNTALERSLSVCEECGQPGRLVDLRVVCPMHDWRQRMCV